MRTSYVLRPGTQVQIITVGEWESERSGQFAVITKGSGCNYEVLYEDGTKQWITTDEFVEIN